ncbi:flagellar hook assembly protein FlgD [Methylobacterium organophilum]|uniref:Basal-body rod modification protein FlgD n=1 Tax=Methylobacterium organophilum TaxID=410 RepID=A0ABQ4T4P4_METOR|nr:flagellar hook capping FlgD N-terminal domain-containing protein [Methylobacterium organophilum]UMY17828.1 flagellar hook assembly protein FlgD [Methylobacterium organophilum]GJE25934.1 hypothetical protein LKMONMHP_0778 [Methylobacterium organophilum]
MTSISNISSSASTSSSASKDAATIAGNFTQFLTLLTTQLKNQNPLDPMDTNQFTQQLVQFAGVEQQLKTNDQLGSILTSAKAAASGSAPGFLGKTVTADGTQSQLSDGTATWTLTADRAATKAVVTITDKDGNTVATKTTTLASGKNSFTWDGTSTTGLVADDGTYSITVDATDATGSKVTVDTSVTGTVDGIDLSGSEPVLVIGNQKVGVSKVKTLGSAS